MLRRVSDRNFSTAAGNSREKKIWTDEEDLSLRKLVESFGTSSKNWTQIAESLPERTGKQCRERWHNHLDVGIKKGDWSEDEDRIIVTMQKAIGNQWAKITKLLPGRTDNAVKNRFHATERAKTRGKFDYNLYADEAVPIEEFIRKEAEKINEDIDISQFYEPKGRRVSKDTTPSVTASIPVAPLDREDSDFTFANAYLSREPSWGVVDPMNETSTPTAAPIEQQQIYTPQTTAPVVPVFPPQMEAAIEDGDEEEYEYEDNEFMADLMELDIISFDEEDMDFMEDDGDVVPERQAGCGNIDPGCFNLDWTRKTEKVEHQSSGWCGLEAWGASQKPVSAGTAAPAFPIFSNNYGMQGQGYFPNYQNSTQMAIPYEQAGPSNGGMSATSYFCSS